MLNDEIIAQFVGDGTPLNAAQVAQLAEMSEVTIEELWAVISVETSGCGFLPSRKPKMLFERHVFHRYYTGSDAPASINSSTPGGYYKDPEREYDRLAQATRYNYAAALKSASWGIGQIMGFNHYVVGYSSINAMVSDFCSAEYYQMLAFVCFIKSKAPMHNALKLHDWKTFAQFYNGPQYWRNRYDEKLENAYERFRLGKGLPNWEVRADQMLCMYGGFDPGPIDGIMGKRTELAIANLNKSWLA